MDILHMSGVESLKLIFIFLRALQNHPNLHPQWDTPTLFVVNADKQMTAVWFMPVPVYHMAWKDFTGTVR